MLGSILITTATLTTLINGAAVKYNVEPALIKAIIKVESNFDPMAYRSEVVVGDASWGLMQVLLSTAKEVTGNSSLTVSELINPANNIDIGTKFLSRQLNRYGGNVKDAIAAYNSGKVRKNAIGQYVNTKGSTNVQRYVDKVYAEYIKYQGINMGALTVAIAIASIALKS